MIIMAQAETQAPEPRRDRGGVLLEENEVLNEDGSVTTVTEAGKTITYSPQVRAFMHQLDSQGGDDGLQPGQHGWWPVWGGTWADVSQGDMVLVPLSQEDGSFRTEAYRIASVTSYDSALENAIWFAFRTPDGKRHGIGRLARPVIYRWETHNVLGGHVR